MTGKLIPMIGKTFGRLTVLERVENNNERKAQYRCQCSCGNTTVTTGKSMRGGNTKSCGCYGYEVRQKARTKHGAATTPTYRIYRGILDRCHNPNSDYYPRYGGKGIFVCAKWRKDFSAFFADMGLRPEGKSIDRINNKLGYSPSNCRWASRIEQANNKTSNRFLTYNGKSKTLAQWSAELGLNTGALAARLKRGMSIEKALTYSKATASATIDGETKSMAEWSRHFGINYGTVRHRLRKGWAIEDAFKSPLEFRQRR